MSSSSRRAYHSLAQHVEALANETEVLSHATEMLVAPLMTAEDAQKDANALVAVALLAVLVRTARGRTWKGTSMLVQILPWAVGVSAVAGRALFRMGKKLFRRSFRGKNARRELLEASRAIQERVTIMRILCNTFEPHSTSGQCSTSVEVQEETDST